MTKATKAFQLDLPTDANRFPKGILKTNAPTIPITKT